MREWKTPISLFGAVLFIGILVSLGLTGWFDQPVLSALALREGKSPGLMIGLAKFFTWLGDGRTRIVIILLFAAWLVWQQRRWAAVAMIVVPALAGTLSSVLKMAFGRARPDLVPHLDNVHDLSFPSGHATSGIATFFLIAFLLPLPLQPKLKLPLLGAGLLIALSRPMLGVHWPTDVIAGGLLGYAAAWMGAKAARDLDPPKPATEPEPIREEIA
jgi:undecaprenyl-diphosphatase